MAPTVGSMSEFRKLLPEGSENAYPSRQKALEVYLDTGGVAKFEKTTGFPKLLYPTNTRLDDQIKEAEEKIAGIDKQINDWHRRHRHLKTNKATDMAALAADPLYWEHQAKLVADPAYRATYDLVKPPMHLLTRDKWRKRLKMFVRSKEYRLRLHEARVSSIGKKRAPMAEEVESRLEFNRQLAEQELGKLDGKRKILHERASAMKTMLSWSRSR